MSKIKKHTDIVSSYQEYETNLYNNVYEEPWIVYIDNGDGTYEIKYSNDSKRTHLSATPDEIDRLDSRLKKIEEEKVYCTEEEYDAIVDDYFNGDYVGVWINNIYGGDKILVKYNEAHLYHIIEN